jgi:hypothetical protein
LRARAIALCRTWSIMQRLTKNPMPAHAHRELTRSNGRCAHGLRVLLLANTLIIMSMFAACGGGSSSSSQQQSATLSGNWQFTVFQNPDPNYPPASYGLQGGFMLQTNGSVVGQAVYSVSNFNGTTPQVCNGGSATIAAGTLSGQSVTLTYPAGSQTFSLTGTLSSDGSTMTGTYTATQGTAADGVTVCGIGTGQSGPQQWTAVLVPPITGPVQGSFHSTDSNAGASLTNQDFLVSGSLVQGPNIGASNATVTGTLTFVDPTTNVSDYPCLSVASVNGQISGSSVVLQIIDPDGSLDGQIGAPAGSAGGTGVNPVSFESVQGGYILNGLQPTYILATKTCPGSILGTSLAGDYGNICLGFNNATACQQPITLSPAVLTFPAQTLVSLATTQTITLSNNSGSTLSGLTLSFSNFGPYAFAGQSDFNGLPGYQASDTCVPETLPPSGTGSPFSLNAGASCTIPVTFTPQESCAWLPFINPPSTVPNTGGSPPEYCPLLQPVQVTVNIPVTSNNVTGSTCPAGNSSSPPVSCAFTVPVTGIGLSAVQPSTPELDFGAEEPLNPPEASLPQMLSFTNNSPNPVQILGSAPCLNQSAFGPLTLPAPRQERPVAGLQVVSNDVYQITPDSGTTPFTILYRCDSDPKTKLPNFQISLDTCTGTLLAPQTSCSLQITYVPQPDTTLPSTGLDYFLELNTLQCFSGGAPTTPSETNPCEVDSGRFPLELKANGPSSLRMSPSAGLDFGNQTVNKSSAPLTITLLNDPNLANPQTVTFVGQISVSGNYSETNDCPVTLAPGSSCTLTVTFKPGSVGFIPGKLTINYSPQSNGSFQQFVYLRGTGQ